MPLNTLVWRKVRIITCVLRPALIRTSSGGGWYDPVRTVRIRLHTVVIQRPAVLVSWCFLGEVVLWVLHADTRVPFRVAYVVFKAALIVVADWGVRPVRSRQVPPFKTPVTVPGIQRRVIHDVLHPRLGVGGGVEMRRVSVAVHAPRV